jgi:serine protease
VTVALADVNKDTQPDKTYDGLQIFEKELSTTTGDEYVPNEFIVKFKPEVGKKKIDKINLGHETSIKRAGSHFMRLNVPEGKTVDEMVKAYSRNPNVEYAEPNHIAHALMVPNDPFYGYQWHLDIPESKEISAWHGENGGGINIEPAWDISTGTGVIVAVIDTGVAYEDYAEFVDGPGRRDYWITYAQAPDLVDTDFVSGHDFVNDDSHPNDDEGHGTHVTGTIAQSTNNAEGVAGVAFGCSIMPIKVLDKDGSGTYVDITDGIYYAADHGAQVISMSLGGTSTSTTLENALAYAHRQGVTIVCSAGNDGAGAAPSYPAAYDAYCIAVGATRYDETVSCYSTTGDYVDIAAPGGDVTVDQNKDGYGDGVLQQTHDGSDYTTFGYYFYQGTSMAAPHISGVAALLISNGVTDPDDVREALQSTAEDKGAIGCDPKYGWGIVDAHAALLFSVGPKPPVADAGSDQTLSDVNNDTVEAVILNGSASYDPDGNIIAYEWMEGDTVLGTAEVITCDFTVGMHNVTLTVTDNDNLTDSDEVIITVEANKAPTADAGPARSVCVNETLTFDGSGSSDPDGTITSYNWDFGDGTTGEGVTPTHIYVTNGTYTVTLMVTDNGGSTDADTAIVTVAEAPAYSTMHIASIDMSFKTAGPNRNAIALVTLLDESNNPVEGATVEGHWSNATTDTDSGLTDASGVVSLKSNKMRNAPSGTVFTFTVDSVSLAGWAYDPAANVETSDSITVP